MRIALPALFLLCILLAGCGQKGPLSLPPDSGSQEDPSPAQPDTTDDTQDDEFDDE